MKPEHKQALYGLVIYSSQIAMAILFGSKLVSTMFNTFLTLLVSASFIIVSLFVFILLMGIVYRETTDE